MLTCVDGRLEVTVGIIAAGPVVAWFWLRALKATHDEFADTVRAIIDIGRFRLLEELRLPLPETLANERPFWEDRAVCGCGFARRAAANAVAEASDQVKRAAAATARFIGRSVPYALWLGLSAWGGWLIWHKYTAGTPAVVRATRDLVADQRIVRDDLETDETKALVGTFARGKIAAGTPITTAMVGPPPHLLKHEGTPAVVLEMPLALRLARDIGTGSVVAVQKGAGILGKGTVLGTDCAEERCAMIVGLDQPLTAADAKALVGADLVFASTLPASAITPPPSSGGKKPPSKPPGAKKPAHPHGK